MTPRITAIVPMRHDSERLKGKNYKKFNGRPLYHWIVKHLMACPDISKIVIDTDSEPIITDIVANFPSVYFIRRPERLRGGDISMNDVLLNTTEMISSDYYVQTHSTNPFLSAWNITAAIDMFLKSIPAYDSLFSVTKVQARLWDELGRPINHNPSILLRTQDLPPVYEESSSLYIFSRDVLERYHNRIGQRPLMFKLSKREAFDIDDETDFTIAELLHQQQGPQ